MGQRVGDRVIVVVAVSLVLVSPVMVVAVVVVVIQRDAEPLRDGAGLDLAEREAARGDDRVGLHRIVDAQHARALAMDVVEEAERRVAEPRCRPRRVLQALLDFLGPGIGPRFEQQRDGAGDMR